MPVSDWTSSPTSHPPLSLHDWDKSWRRAIAAPCPRACPRVLLVCISATSHSRSVPPKAALVMPSQTTVDESGMLQHLANVHPHAFRMKHPLGPGPHHLFSALCHSPRRRSSGALTRSQCYARFRTVCRVFCHGRPDAPVSAAGMRARPSEISWQTRAVHEYELGSLRDSCGTLAYWRCSRWDEFLARTRTLLVLALTRTRTLLVLALTRTRILLVRVLSSPEQPAVQVSEVRQCLA